LDVVECGDDFLAKGAVEPVFGRGGESYDEDVVVAAGEGEFSEGGAGWWGDRHVGQRAIVEMEGVEEELAMKVMEARTEALIYLYN
jgi:hypothetical protein